MHNSHSPSRPIEHIVVCGGGLAAWMTVAVLGRQLPASIRITFLQAETAPGADLFYGTVVGPTAYAFNRTAGLEEPGLILDSDTAFSWGTKYDHWANGAHSWIQCFQLPLPVLDGVMFHHYVAQQGLPKLEPSLVSAVAARKGVFAHPPQQPGRAGQTLLSRAEYGYQFDPRSYAALFETAVDKRRIRLVRPASWEIEKDQRGIAAIQIAGGERIAGDLFVDCTGPDASLLTHLGSPSLGTRQLGATLSASPAAQLGPPMRTVGPTDYGWRSETPIRGRRLHVTVYHPDSREAALRNLSGNHELSCDVTIGRREDPWSGNCVAVGQAAAVAEPLTIAPMLLLERDIERLISLVPFSADMSVELREYNRRAAEDYEHASLFTHALFQTEGLPNTPYWEAARAEPVHEKLARKIELFQDRGMLVAYDLEPFHPEDWTILHYGMGRRPDRHDRVADRAAAENVRNFLASMKRDVEKLVSTLPSHYSYVDQLSRFLKQNKS